ncbi:MAG TPA: RNB domain-containing ribonuclease, partial [Micavibrio sp.]
QGHGQNRTRNGQHAARPEDVPLDFNPRVQLEKVLRSRPVQQGITIDPAGTYIIDDGLWVRPHDRDGWHITASIADLPAMIPARSKLEEVARTRMEETFIARGQLRRLWPVDFLENFVSLRALPDRAARPAVTFTMILDKNLDVQHFKVKRTAFINNGQHTDGAFHGYRDFPPEMATQWQRLARGLYQKRCRELSVAFDRHVYPDAALPPTYLTKDNGNMSDGKLLVHEVMRLTNRLATKFFQERGLAVPFKTQKVGINATMVSPAYEFDMAANRMCIRLLEHMAENELPYVHLNSPMRKYGDYLALKVLGSHLNGNPPPKHVVQEVEDLSSIFNRHAQSVPDYLLQQRWKSEWSGQLRNQAHQNANWHPQPVPQQQASYELVKACQDLQFDKPLIAEREMMVQGTYLYFTTMAVDGGRFHAEAVSHNAGQSHERAAERLMKTMIDKGVWPKAAP